MSMLVTTATCTPTSPVITRSARGSPDVNAQREAVYSRKKKTVEQKLACQLFSAMVDQAGFIKSERSPFEVPIPLGLSGKPIQNAPFTSGVAQHIGSREIQEDRFLQNAEVSFSYEKKEYKGRLFGVFDGHADQGKVGEFFSKHLCYSLAHLLSEQADKLNGVTEETITNALAGVFPLLSNAYGDRGGLGGATAACAFIYEQKVYLPNVGDSRIILVKPGASLQLTEDANVSNKRFQKWHLKEESKSEFVEIDREIRIVSKDDPKLALNVARNVGAQKWMCHRPKITRIFLKMQPDHYPRGEIYGHKGCFLVLASDGLSDTATVQEVGAAVRILAKAGATPQQIAEQLVNHAVSYKDNDNITAMVVAL